MSFDDVDEYHFFEIDMQILLYIVCLALRLVYIHYLRFWKIKVCMRKTWFLLIRGLDLGSHSLSLHTRIYIYIYKVVSSMHVFDVHKGVARIDFMLWCHYWSFEWTDDGIIVVGYVSGPCTLCRLYSWNRPCCRQFHVPISMDVYPWNIQYNNISHLYTAYIGDHVIGSLFCSLYSIHKTRQRMAIHVDWKGQIGPTFYGALSSG